MFCGSGPDIGGNCRLSGSIQPPPQEGDGSGLRLRQQGQADERRNHPIVPARHACSQRPLLNTLFRLTIEFELNANRIKNVVIEAIAIVD